MPITIPDHISPDSPLAKLLSRIDLPVLETPDITRPGKPDSPKSWQVCGYAACVMPSGVEQRMPARYTIADHPLIWISQDDDGNVYAWGTCADNGIDEQILDRFAVELGAAWCHLFDRATGAYLDTGG